MAELDGVDTWFRGEYAYITGRQPDGGKIPLMRLHYSGSAARWGFARPLRGGLGQDQPAAEPLRAVAAALPADGGTSAAVLSHDPAQLTPDVKSPGVEVEVTPLQS